MALASSSSSSRKLTSLFLFIKIEASEFLCEFANESSQELDKLSEDKLETFIFDLYKSRAGDREVLFGLRIVDILVRIDVFVFIDEGDRCAFCRYIFHVASLLWPSFDA